MRSFFEAALLIETGKPLVLAEIEIPALKPGQVLVDVAYSGVCHTQVLEARGHKGPDPWVPHCMGHEGSGTVLETGAGVTRVKAGDKIGAVGATGLVSGPNLHYEVRVDGRPIDPTDREALPEQEIASSDDLNALASWRRETGFVQPAAEDRG